MTTPGQQQIEVDLLALQQSKDGIANKINKALENGISDVRGRIYRGVPAGELSRSGEVDASRQAIAEAMHRFWVNGEAYMGRVARVTEFLGKVLEEYRNADDLAKLSVDAVGMKLNELRHATGHTPNATPSTREFA